MVFCSSAHSYFEIKVGCVQAVILGFYFSKDFFLFLPFSSWPPAHFFVIFACYYLRGNFFNSKPLLMRKESYALQASFHYLKNQTYWLLYEKDETENFSFQSLSNEEFDFLHALVICICRHFPGWEGIITHLCITFRFRSAKDITFEVCIKWRPCRKAWHCTRESFTAVWNCV